MHDLLQHKNNNIGRQHKFSLRKWVFVECWVDNVMTKD